MKMKKKIALLPLMVFALSACSLPTSNEQPQENNQQQPEQQQTPQEAANDAAITILNNTTFFPEVGDEVDLSEYVTFDAGFGHTLSEYTFTSKDNTVISIEGYHATCLKRGYTAIAVSGPGINRKTEINFFVGSIAGTYKPDSARLRNMITFTVGETNTERMAEFQLNINQGTYKNNSVAAYSGSGSLFKNGTPFLTLTFEGAKPNSFAPISSYLSLFGINASNEITDSVYGLMSYDVEYGVSIKTVFMGDIIEFFAQ